MLCYDADIPVNDLAEQLQSSHQQVAALVSDAKRMSPDGNLAKDLVVAGYQLVNLPPWFGISAKDVLRVPRLS